MNTSKKLNTEILFQLLVKYIKPEVICDIGTLDAHHSVLLRHISKSSRIVAFEANPYNYKKILESKLPEKENIELVHQAISNEPGTLTFNIQKHTDPADEKWVSGTSSILQRNQEVGDTEKVTVDANRLDKFLIDSDPRISDKSIALWIDVEGAGYAVLEGITGIHKSILFIQIEVETREIWQGQKLKSDVIKLMDNLGFIEVARGKHEIQHDLVFINNEFLTRNKKLCNFLIRLAVLFYYIRKWGGHILSDILLIPILGIWRNS